MRLFIAICVVSLAVLHMASSATVKKSALQDKIKKLEQDTMETLGQLLSEDADTLAVDKREERMEQLQQLFGMNEDAMAVDKRGIPCFDKTEVCTFNKNNCCSGLKCKTRYVLGIFPSGAWCQ